MEGEEYPVLKRAASETGLRKSRREAQPSAKLLENLEQEKEVVDEFWTTVKKAKLRF